MNTHTTSEVEEIKPIWLKEYEEEFGWSDNYLLDDFQIKFFTTLTTKHQEELEKAVEAEKKRILDELWRLVEWYSEEKNQMFGAVSANTTINALHQARGIVRGDNYATASQPAPTKTDKQ